MLRIEEQFLVRINYKSGNNIEMWFKQFDYHKKGESVSVTHEAVGSVARAIVVGVDEIESVYQLDARRRIRFGRKKK